MASAVAPIVKSVFLCDHVEVDPETGKPTVHGLFNSLRVEFVPDAVSVLEDFCVFAEFIGGVSDAFVRVEIVHSETGTVVVHTPNRLLHFPERHTIVYLSMRIAELAVAEPGVYIVELYCNDSFVDDRVLNVMSREENQ